VPVTQRSPLAHPWPQAPQFASSAWVSMQEPVPPSPPLEGHSVNWAAQVRPHAPPEQTWPAAQATPHAPQLALSVSRLMQASPHCCRPVWQLTAQTPAEQTWPAAQVLPQVPQFASSRWRFTQAPLQSVKLVGQPGAAPVLPLELPVPAGLDFVVQARVPSVIPAISSHLDVPRIQHSKSNPIERRH